MFSENAPHFPPTRKATRASVGRGRFECVPSLDRGGFECFLRMSHISRPEEKPQGRVLVEVVSSVF